MTTDELYANPDAAATAFIGALGGLENCKGSGGFSGRVDDIRIFNRALSPAALNTLANQAPNP